MIADHAEPPGSPEGEDVERHAGWLARAIEELGAEDISKKIVVYLGTISHVLPEAIVVLGLRDPSAFCSRGDRGEGC